MSSTASVALTLLSEDVFSKILLTNVRADRRILYREL